MGKKKKKQNPSKQNPDNFQYIVYTDGGCIQNPGGRGGYGAVIIDTETGEITEKHGGFISTTNNRMEMMAVLIALETLPKNCTVLLHADSQYVLRTMSGEYSKKKNLDLWKKIDAARVGKKISLEWVPGHAGISENERCDELAAASYMGEYLQVDIGYEQRLEEGRQFYQKIDDFQKNHPGAYKRQPESEPPADLILSH